MKTPVIVRILKDQKLLDVKQFDTDQIIIGQGVNVHIYLEGDSISPIHGLIEVRDSGYYVCDLGSLSGIFKNGIKVLDEPLTSGDQLMVGPYLIQFFVGIPKPKGAPVPAPTLAPALEQAYVTQTSESSGSAPGLVSEPVSGSVGNSTEHSIAGSRSTRSSDGEKTSEFPMASMGGGIDSGTQKTSAEGSHPGGNPSGGVTGTSEISTFELNPSAASGSMAASGSTVISGSGFSRSSSSGSAQGFSSGKPRRKGFFGTYAPPSQIEDLRAYLKPQKGAHLEVLVAWGDRILTSYHISPKSHILMGAQPGADIFIPTQFVPNNIPLVEMSANGVCQVLATPQMGFELITANSQVLEKEGLLESGRAQRRSGGGFLIRLDQGETVCVHVDGDLLQVFIRFSPQVRKPLLAPMLDFTSGELTSLIVAAMCVALFSIYMAIHGSQEDQPKEDLTDQLRMAQFVYEKKFAPLPTPTPAPVVKPPPEPSQPPPPTPRPQPSRPPQPTPPPKKVPPTPQPRPSAPPLKPIEVTKKPENSSTNSNPSSDQKKNATASSKKETMAQASDVREVPNTSKKKGVLTSVAPQGGAVKMGNVEGSSAQSKKDVTSKGFLSSFGANGIRSELDKAQSGVGGLLGEADKVTGFTGQASNRNGDDIGARLKDMGVSGKGMATQGISGIRTKGRSSGLGNYGQLGTGGSSEKTQVAIQHGGSGEAFEGTINREAVRRVIQSILHEIKSCYERRLRFNSGLEGKLYIRFVIEAEGAVHQASVVPPDLDDAQVGICVVNRIKEQRFPEPPPGSTAEVTYPFTFGAQK